MEPCSHLAVSHSQTKRNSRVSEVNHKANFAENRHTVTVLLGPSEESYVFSAELPDIFPTDPEYKSQ